MSALETAVGTIGLLDLETPLPTPGIALNYHGTSDADALRIVQALEVLSPQWRATKVGDNEWLEAHVDRVTVTIYLAPEVERDETPQRSTDILATAHIERMQA